ncbi:MAG: type II toxin-antitoxin system RelE/ParE family toxin [Nitrospiria bacterium]
MVYTIEFKPSAARDLAKLQQDIQKRIAAKINALAREPRPPGVETLAGQDGLLRLRVGDYRILYQVLNKVLTILVVRIRHRREVYRDL